jgi:hypothetical protein
MTTVAATHPARVDKEAMYLRAHRTLSDYGFIIRATFADAYDSEQAVRALVRSALVAHNHADRIAHTMDAAGLDAHTIRHLGDLFAAVHGLTTLAVHGTTWTDLSEVRIAPEADESDERFAYLNAADAVSVAIRDVLNATDRWTVDDANDPEAHA